MYFLPTFIENSEEHLNCVRCGQDIAGIILTLYFCGVRHDSLGIIQLIL